MILVIAILLILVVLAQNPKGGGLSSQFGGAGSTQLMGVKKTGDFLEKLTWGFAIGLLVLSIVTNFIIPQETEDFSSPNIDNVRQNTVIPPALEPTAGSELEGLELDTEGSTTTDSVN